MEDEVLNFINNYVNSEAFADRAKRNLLATDAVPYKRYLANAKKSIKTFKGIQRYDSGTNFFNTLKHIIKGDSYRSYNSKFTKPVNGSNADVRNGIIYLDYDADTSFAPIDDVLAHEYGHIIDPATQNDADYKSQNNVPANYKKLYQKQHKDKTYYKGRSLNNRHDTNPAEIYADIMELRWDMYKNGIYDSTKKEPFTKDHLNKVKSNKKINKNSRILRGFDDNDIIQLLNTVADTNSRKRTLEAAGKYEV